MRQNVKGGVIMNKKETKGNKVANTNQYLCALADRMKELRVKKELSQKELAKRIGTTREKVMYIELNIQGRNLKVEELAEASKVLGTSTDYLLGLTNSMTSNNNNGLSDETNKLTDKMKDQIGILDKMIPEFEDKKELDFLQAYLTVSYINKNVLPYILNEVKLKTTNQKELTSADIQKIEFLMMYVSAFSQQKVDYADYIHYLYDKNKQIFTDTYDSVSQHFFYNEDKNIKIDYETIGKIRPILSEFENFAEYEVYKRLQQSIKDMTYDYVKDDTYFNEIKQYYKQITISK